ncbi:MAG: hypothetical protein ACLPT4_07885 [Verrucomicrobiia bacterium]
MSGSDSPSGQHEIPRTPKGLDLAADLVKQVITLSTAVTAFTATFAKNFSPSVNGGTVVPGSLRWSWVFFIVAIFFGILSLMTVVGTANNIEAGKVSLGASDPYVRSFVGLTMLAFFIGLVLTVVASFSIIG